MTVNKTNQTLDNRLLDKLKSLDTEILALKTRQLLGGDNLVIGASTTIGGFVTIPQFSHTNFTISLQSANSSPNLFPNFYFTIYVDTDNDPTYIWPVGTSLSTDTKQNLRVWWRFDLDRSDPDTGYHVITMQIFNGTISDKDIYIHARFYYPDVAV